MWLYKNLLPNWISWKLTLWWQSDQCNGVSFKVFIFCKKLSKSLQAGWLLRHLCNRTWKSFESAFNLLILWQKLQPQWLIQTIFFDLVDYNGFFIWKCFVTPTKLWKIKVTWCMHDSILTSIWWVKHHIHSVKILSLQLLLFANMKCHKYLASEIFKRLNNF